MSGCNWILGIEEYASRDAAPSPVDAPDARSDGRPSDGVPPRVVSATPEPDTAGVATDVEIAVTFDEAIDPGSVDEASFQLVDGRHGRATVGTVSVDGAVVRFAPAAELTLHERYEIVIGTAVTDLSGTPLAQEWRGAFTMREGVFGAAGAITHGAVASRAMSMGGRGQAFALWWDDGTIYSRRYQAPSGWESTELVAYTSAPDSLAVATGLEDAALAVWQNGMTREAASYVDSGVAWVEATMEGGGGPAQVGIDARGNGLAAWLRDDGTHTGVVASRFSGAQWSAPIPLDQLASSASALQLAVDDAGDGLALWVQGDQIWTARFRDGLWDAATVLEPATGLAREPRLVLDGDGRGMAFWLQQDGTQYRLRWSSYEPKTGWSEPAFADGGPAVDPDQGVWRGAFAFNSHGDAVVMWNERTSCGGGEQCNLLFADHFDLQQGWHDLQAISDSYTQFGFLEYSVVMDRHGNALAGWTVNASVTPLELWLRRYVPERGWDQGANPSCAERAGYSGLRLSASPQGRMLASWSEDADTLGYAFCTLALD
jgi:hypothetical protein